MGTLRDTMAPLFTSSEADLPTPRGDGPAQSVPGAEQMVLVSVDQWTAMEERCRALEAAVGGGSEGGDAWGGAISPDDL